MTPLQCRRDPQIYENAGARAPHRSQLPGHKSEHSSSCAFVSPKIAFSLGVLPLRIQHLRRSRPGHFCGFLVQSQLGTLRSDLPGMSPSDVDLRAELATDGVLELCPIMPGWP